MRTVRTNRRPNHRERRQRGSGLLMSLFLLLGMIGFLVMVTSLGQAYLAHGQLQTAADAASKAAIGIMKQGRSRLAAREQAKIVGGGTKALEDASFFTDDQVQFGDFDHDTETFQIFGTDHSPAVRVFARRQSGIPGGPIELFMGGILGWDELELEASSTASTGCREVVFAVDSSEGMAQEITSAYSMVSQFVFRMGLLSRAGDKVGITIYAGDGLSMPEYANNGGQFWSRPVPEELSALPAEQVDINAWITAMGQWGNYCDDPRDRSNPQKSRLPTLGRGSCLGKGDHHGINQAIQMFDDLEDSCSSEGERLIVFITSDVPCAWRGWHVGDRRTPYYGGTLADAYAAADSAWAAGINVQPVLIQNGQVGNCPYTGEHAWQHSDSPWSFANKMARGFPANGGSGALINPSQNQINALINDLNEVLFVRLVE